MKKTITIIIIVLGSLFVSQKAEAVLKVYNYTGLQMNIKLSTGIGVGVSSTPGLSVFGIPTASVMFAHTYPGITTGGTGSGIIEWLGVGRVGSGFPAFATSAYTWGGAMGVVNYSVSFVESGADIILYITP